MRKLFCLFCIMLPISTASYASSCTDTLNQISASANNYNVTWLTKQLGTPQTTTAEEQWATWGSCQVYFKKDAHTSVGCPDITGKDAQGFPSSATLQDYIKALGNPKTIQTEKTYRYTWICEQSNLTIDTTAQNVVLWFHVKICSPNAQGGYSSCSSFGGNTSASTNLFKTFSQAQMSGFNQAMNKLNTDTIQSFNEHFKTSLKTGAELKDATLKLITNYYTHLRQCAPGTYQFAMPMPFGFGIYIFPTAVIKGMQNGTCQVNTLYHKPGEENQVEICNFTPQSLSVFTDKVIEDIANGNASFNTANPTPLEKAYTTECKIVTGGS